MNRRVFIKTSALTAFSVGVFGTVSKAADGTFFGDCETTNDILGPKYREGAPIRSDMIFEGIEGEQIWVKGKVYTEDCTTPLENCTVELWHCNINGEYDDTSRQFRHRAKLITDTNGEYAFRTIIPGRYLNGRLYRPAHYHVRVRADGHKELISQLYFQGDPHIAKDPWASKPKAKERILEIVPGGGQEPSNIIFNIYLPGLTH